MIGRLNAAYHWVQARRDELKLGPAAALRRIERMEALRPLPDVASAYKAWLLLGVGRVGEADRLFGEVEAKLAEPADANEAYLRLFCQFYGRYRVSRLEQADALWESAQQLQCSDMLRRYLPFFRKPSEVHADPRFADLDTSPVARRYFRKKRG